MDPIKNTGATDYAVAMPQAQQYPQAMEDYTSMPMVYDEEVENKKKSASNMVGMVALGAIALGCAGYALKKRGDVKDLKNVVDDLTTKNEKLVKELDEANKKLNKKSFFGNLASKKHWYNPFSWGSKSEKKAAEKVEETVKEAAAEAAK